MALHVLQLGPMPPPEGGVSRNMLAIRDALLKAGDRCSIIATTKGTADADEADVYRPRSAFALLRLPASMKFNVLHLHIGGDVSPRVLALVFACSIFGRGRSVLTLHSGAYPQTPEGKAAKRVSIRGFIFRRFSRVIAVNASIADVFRRYGVKNESLRVVLPYTLNQPDETVSIPPSLKSFFEQHSPLLLAVGGLEPDYDPLFQLSVMKDVLAEFPGAGLMIVGDGSMRGDVGMAAAASGYSENICIAGNVDHEVTLHLINDADVLLRTTLFDGDAISVREALHLGTPIIATDNGMRPNGVKLIQTGDRSALVSKLKEAIELGKSSEEPAEPDNSNILEILKIYRELT